MSKSKTEKNDVTMALARKLGEARLPQDITCIIDRKFKFVINNKGVVAGIIRGFVFDSPVLFLLIDRGEIEMTFNRKGVLRGVFGGEGKWEGTLQVL